MAGCEKGVGPFIEVETPDNESIPVEIAKEEDVPDGETKPKEYDSYIEPHLAKIYLEVLAEKKEEINSPAKDVPNDTDSNIAILDVFGDKTPELLYIYRHDWLVESDILDNYLIPCFSLEVLSYSESRGVESVFDSTVFIAAGGGDSYCVYLSSEGELILYRSTLSGGTTSWGFWQVTPAHNLEITEEYWAGNYCSDLAKLYYARFYDEGETLIYKSNGEEISVEQHAIVAKEVMGGIERVLFQFFALYEHDDLWKDITPFEADYLTYTGEVEWLKEQIEIGQ